MGRRPFAVVAVALGASCLAAAAWPRVELRLSIDAIGHAGYAARGITLVWRGQDAQLEIAGLRVLDREFTRLKLVCPDLSWQGGRLRCPAGLLSGDGIERALRVALDARPTAGTLDLAVSRADGGALDVSLSGHGAARAIAVRAAGWRLADLAPWHELLRAFGARGRLDAQLRVEGEDFERLQADLALSDAAFASADGSRAGERLAATARIDARRTDAGWQGRLAAAWQGGELYWQPWYAADLRVDLSADFAVDETQLALSRAEVTIAGLGRLTAAGRWDRARHTLDALQLATDGIDLGAAHDLLGAPYLAQAGLPAPRVSGLARGRLDWRDRGDAALEIALDGVRLGDRDGRHGLHGISGRLAWGSRGEHLSSLVVAGGHLGRLPLGGFELTLLAGGARLAAQTLRVPVLDGELRLSEFSAARRADAGWDWSLGVALTPVSMGALSRVLGLPAMAGRVAASIPRVRQSGSTIRLDGALVVQVFDGYVSATDLAIVEPFGRLPRLTADLELRHLDLGQLTEAFSFGDITGYVEGEVTNLELARWRPQRFEARIASSPGEYRRRISQRAVETITALGGAGAAAAIQRSVLRFFERFGYERIGWRCVLRDGVCRMGGIEGLSAAGDGYVIVKGGGLPAIEVVGYNREVDWNELVARLARVIEANAKPVIE